jgi:ACS family pantothenate transporter-like MFS transporter
MIRWMAELISDNAEQRAFTAASMNTLQCEFVAEYYLVASTEQPDSL